MIKYTTRFNPTTNGPLHIGHAYMILLNEREAHTSGGKFIVRFEDNQPEWMWRVSKDRAEQYIKNMKQDIEWLGIPVDEYQLQSEMEEKVYDTIKFVNGGELKAEKRLMFDNNMSMDVHSSDVLYYPYAPYLTAEKVINDVLSGVNLVIRGEDLVSEFSLYSYFCDIWKIPKPQHIYMPRLKTNINSELQANVSKTSGNNRIYHYRESGLSAEELIEKLKISCLVDPKGDWLVRNIKRVPLWSG